MLGSLCQFISVQLLSCVRLSATPWITARQASLSITSSRSLLKLMLIESVMPSSHLILCRPLLLLPPISPSIRVFYNKSTLRMRWPKYWSFSFSISPSNEHLGLISFRRDWLDLLAGSLCSLIIKIKISWCFTRALPLSIIWSLKDEKWHSYLISLFIFLTSTEYFNHHNFLFFLTLTWSCSTME